MSEQLLPSGLKFGDGLGDFISFTSDGCPARPISQQDVASDERRRDFHPVDTVSVEDGSLLSRGGT